MMSATPTADLPLVTVVIPFYNEERFLAEAVESVRSQDYLRWELLLVDDGSSDGSVDIARGFADREPERTRFLQHPGGVNRGVCASRNLGVSQARGELIAVLDADDVWLPGKLTSDVMIFGTHPEIAMVVSATEYWRDWEDASRPNEIRRVGSPQDRTFQPRELLKHLYPLAGGVAPNPSSLLIRRSVVQQLGGFEEAFTHEYQLYEDQAFLCKAYLSQSVYVSSSCHTRYRLHSGSTTARVRSEYHRVREYFLVWLEAYIREQRIVDGEVRRSLTRALLPYRSPWLHKLFYKGPARLRELLDGLTFRRTADHG
jgi:glycosyltransferase involved in cell wall biosynthesis